MANQDQPPIVISPTTVTNVLSAAARMAVVLSGAVTAIIGFLSKRDLIGLMDYFQSSAFIPVAGAVASALTFGYALWRTWKNKKTLIKVGDAAPDSFAVVQHKDKTK